MKRIAIFTSFALAILSACSSSTLPSASAIPPTVTHSTTLPIAPDQTPMPAPATDIDQTPMRDSNVSSPGIMVGAVHGNTAEFGSVAEFSVQLASKPTALVAIPLASSDEAQGIPEQVVVRFTPENWFQAQTVVVRGTAERVQHDAQSYQILLGAAVSDDPRYQGLDPQDVTLSGILLVLSAPDDGDGLIANIPATIHPVVQYTGNDLLSFALTQAPDQMVIELSTGMISWTPQTTDQGQQYTIGVSVNDGYRFTETQFQVTVMQPDPLVVTRLGNTLTVADPTTTLNYMTITQRGAGDVDALELGKLAINVVPEVPASVTALSDVFVHSGSFDHAVDIQFPLTNLPANVSLDDVHLYAFTEAIDVAGHFWSPVSIATRYEGTSDDPRIVVRVARLAGMAFWGYEHTNPTGSHRDPPYVAVAYTVPQQAPTPNASPCIQLVGPAPANALLDDYVCTIASASGNASIHATSTITITGWGPSTTITRWGDITKEQLIADLVTAQTWFTNHGLGFDTQFTVAIHQMSDPSTFGYVTTNEARKTLHLTNMDDKPSGTMRGTFIHEYFHHAQGHPATTITGKDLLINGGTQANWFIEGTARWIEDELLDSLDTYMYMEGWGSRIAEVGINNGTGNGLQRPYQRFSFFKLLTQQCPQFDPQFRTFLNVDLDTDPSGIANLVAFFDQGTCDFGDMFGSDTTNKTLAAALTYYNYGTQFQNKLSLFDSNETTDFDVSTNTGFRFDMPNASFNGWKSTIQQWVDAPTTKAQLNDVSTIAPAGAYSFRIPALSGELPPGKVAEFIVESGQEVFVSITSASDQFKGENTIGNHPHSWFSTKQQTSYPYAATGTPPELFVTIVNPSLEARASIKIFFHIRDELTMETAITSHTDGDSVSRRVETIAGSIPEAARATTTKVTVTVNGIATDTPVNADGSFSIEGVMALGDNIIKVQGIDGSSKPTTKEQMLTLRGIESGMLERNALLSSRAVFVLRWDTADSDIDVYSTDITDNTIWFNNLVVGQGILDYDDTDGFGPEVISYRTSGDDGYANGNFEVDVHYYQGAVPTTFTLDVVLNETEGSNRRVLRFQSTIPLPSGISGENGPAGNGSSRVNNIMRIGCSTQAVCSLTQFDPTILTQFTEASR